MSSLPPKRPAPPGDPDRVPWPEIDRLTADVVVAPPPRSAWYAAAKVLVDYLTAVVLLPVALPLIAAAAAVVKVTSPGPAFYTQTRLGLNGRRYKIIKIRTMHHDCEVRSGIKWAGKNDARVTRFGKLLRTTHVDELPQIFNVLLGDMSLVGPRPERPEVILAKGLEQLVPGYPHRLLVKPGVTGLAQVQLPADSDLTSVRYKVVYDLYYVQNQGLLLDLRLIVATLVKAAGAGPRLIRRAFFLPNREKIADGFRQNLTRDGGAIVHLQPA